MELEIQNSHITVDMCHYDVTIPSVVSRLVRVLLYRQEAATKGGNSSCFRYQCNLIFEVEVQKYLGCSQCSLLFPYWSLQHVTWSERWWRGYQAVFYLSARGNTAPGWRGNIEGYKALFYFNAHGNTSPGLRENIGEVKAWYSTWSGPHKVKVDHLHFGPRRVQGRAICIDTFGSQNKHLQKPQWRLVSFREHFSQ